MRILTVLGTRPEIVRLRFVIERLDELADHRVVHTGQNFAPMLSEEIVRDLGARAPDLHLGIRAASFGEQAGAILAAMEGVLDDARPDRVLVLGDTNSGLAALVAKRRGLPVLHLEAGNRCHDERVPEEVNRRVIDHASDVWMPYTERSRANLLREGIPDERIHVVGNPIREVLLAFDERIAASTIRSQLGLASRAYFLVTLHRAENVDDPARLTGLVEALGAVHVEHGSPIVVSTHPRTRARLDAAGLEAPPGVRFLEPFGFVDFVALEREARCVLTDSGTVQEECCLLATPNVTLRETTERPETIDCGSNVLGGIEREGVLRAVRVALASPTSWVPPAEYLVADTSHRVARIALGHLGPSRR